MNVVNSEPIREHAANVRSMDDKLAWIDHQIKALRLQELQARTERDKSIAELKRILLASGRLDLCEVVDLVVDLAVYSEQYGRTHL